MCFSERLTTIERFGVIRRFITESYLEVILVPSLTRNATPDKITTRQLSGQHVGLSTARSAADVCGLALLWLRYQFRVGCDDVTLQFGHLELTRRVLPLCKAARTWTVDCVRSSIHRNVLHENIYRKRKHAWSITCVETGFSAWKKEREKRSLWWKKFSLLNNLIRKPADWLLNWHRPSVCTFEIIRQSINGCE